MQHLYEDNVSANKSRDIARRKKNLGLLTAAYMGHISCVNFLFKEGADVNCSEEMFGRGYRYRIAVIMGNGVDIKDTEALVDDCSPLTYAALNGHLEVLKIFSGSRSRCEHDQEENCLGRSCRNGE